MRSYPRIRMLMSSSHWPMPTKVSSIPSRLLLNESFRLHSGEQAPFQPQGLDNAVDVVFGHHIRSGEALRPRLTVAGRLGKDLLGGIVGHLVDVVVPQHPRITA